uniref:LPD38 domain-containing protein n=1 Tax=Porphyromonas loveana TaxID=1884669 RepID=UPI0035A0B594
SKAQQEAGNYKKAHVNVQGFDITIENPKGSTRSGVDESGKEWSITMQNDYGYFKRSEGKDGDQIDVFIGNNPESGKIFVVDQVNPETGVFDESKVMLGFNSEEEAKKAYLSNYEEGWQGLGAITETDAEYFKEWLYDGKKQRKAFSEYKDVVQSKDVEFRLVGGNSGYVGYSMSKRAAAAREEGRFPKTDFKKEYGVSDKILQGLVDAGVIDNSEWHHTSKYGNKTTFYSWNGRYYHDIYMDNKDAVSRLVEDGKKKELFDLFDRENRTKTEELQNSLDNRVLEARMEISSKYSEYVKGVRENLAKSNYTASGGSVVIPNGKTDYFNMDVEKDGVKLSKRNGKKQRDAAGREYIDYVNSNIMSKSEWLSQNIALVDSVLSKHGVTKSDVDLGSGEGGVRFRMSDEESRIKDRAIADGTFMKAPNGRPTNLNEQQWLQVRTEVFKKWFGDWEKSARIEKLRKAKPVEITGKEVKPSDDLKQYKKNALEYGKTLRGEYTNKDTGEKIAIGKRGVKEVLQHDYKDREHLQSIAAIPQIIENSIYIDTLPNEDVDKNPDVKAYQYYVSGLKIGGEDYTARAAIAVDSQGNRYYDHKLTDIEKGELLNAMVGITNPVSQKTSPPSGYKDTKLVSLLQTNSSKVVDENGEPLVVYHGTREDGFSIFDDMEGNKLSDAPEGVSFFTDMKSVAYTYSGRYDRPHYELEEDEEGVGSIYEVFLNIRDPRFEDFGGAGWDGQAWGKAALLDEENIEVYPNDGRRFFDSLSEAEDFAQEYDYQNYYVQKDPSVGYTTNEIAEEAMADGNDGAIFYDVVDVGSYGAEQESTVYVTFHPSQIKSATDNTGAFNEKNNDIRFRLSDGPVVDTEDLKKGIRRENRFQRTMDKFQEAYQDTYLPVKRLYERIEAQGVKVEDWENFYAQATHIPGKNQAEIEVYTSKYMNPMIEQVKVLKDKGFSYREIENYVMLKHGKERNEYMRERESAKYLKKHPRATAAKIDELKSKDYAGVRDIAKEVGDLGDIPEIGTAERIAAKFVHDVEVLCGDEAIGSFWDAVTAATRFSLTKSYHSGILSKAGYDELVSRYKYYVPLRGHDAITAEDKWDYISESGSPTFSSPIKRAKGRSTRAESPFAFIFQTAQSSIMAGNKNRLKSTLLNLAESGKAGTLFNISKSWYEKAGTDEQGNDAWQLAVPKYDEDPVVYSENIVNFEKRMKEEAKKGNAVQSRRKLDLDGMFIKPHQAAEHEIHIRRNGEDLVLYINADPALARSVNGANRVISDSRFMHGARWSTRQIAAMSTSLNPLFTASNFMRDLQYSVVKLGAEKGGKFTAGYSVRLGRILFKDRVLIRMLNGQLDLSKKYDQYAYEFLMNGGKTGYVSALNLETTAHRIEKELKRLGVRELSALNPAKEAYLAEQCTRAMGDFFVMGNEVAENSIRLAAYITARENGESIVSSVNTAKEVTVNFNRRGSGAMGADAINSLFMFTNVAFQALDNFAKIAKIAKKHKWKLAATMAAYMLSGFLQSWWIDVFGSDDSKEAYWGTSDWDRQNNLCIPIGRGLFKIPHPQELRALRGLGVGIYQSIKGTKAPEDTVLDLLSAVADVVPMGSTFVPAEASVSGVVTAVSPTVLQPVTQWVANMNFKGNPVRNAYASEYAPGHLQARTNRKGQPRADRWIYDLCEFINVSVGRGDGAKKGWIDLNPDAVQHFAGGYFGGLFNTASSTVNTIYMAQNGEAVRELRIRDTPLRRFYAETADMNNVDSGTMSKFYDISDKADQAHYMFGRYKKQLQDKSLTQEEYREKIEALNYPYWESIRDELSAIRRLERRLKDVAEDEQVKLDMKSAEMKRQLVKRYEKDMEVKHEE